MTINRQRGMPGGEVSPLCPSDISPVNGGNPCKTTSFRRKPESTVPFRGEPSLPLSEGEYKGVPAKRDRRGMRGRGRVIPSPAGRERARVRAWGGAGPEGLSQPPPKPKTNPPNNYHPSCPSFQIMAIMVQQPPPSTPSAPTSDSPPAGNTPTTGDRAYLPTPPRPDAPACHA